MCCHTTQKCPRVLLILCVAQAYSSAGDTRQIVTGVSERVAGSVIRYWIQESGSKKPVQRKLQGEMGRGRAYLTGYVR